MKLRDLTNLYVDAKAALEEERGPPKKQKAVEGLSLGDELIRDAGIVSFMMGTIFALIAVAGPPLHEGYDVTKPPTFVKPDWYLLWSLGPIFLAKWPVPNPLHMDFVPEWLAIGPDPLIDTKFLGTLLVNAAFVALILVPFVSKGKARRPVEAPGPAAAGVLGLAFIWWMSIVGIADVIFAYEVKTMDGSLHWFLEAGWVPSPSELIDYLGIISVWHTILPTLLAFWLIARHKPRYESKLNATYYKVR